MVKPIAARPLLRGVPAATSASVAGFGSHLATHTVAASGTLGTSLGGTTVNITDAGNVTTPAEIFFASAGQVNFLIPPGIALGTGKVQIMAGDGTSSVGPTPLRPSRRESSRRMGPSPSARPSRWMPKASRPLSTSPITTPRQ